MHYPSMRTIADISSYFVVGPDDTRGRDIADILRQALRAGITVVQLRAKHTDAGEMITLCRQCANVIAEEGKSEQVPLLVDDRLDVVLAAREAGIKIDGIHVGQHDIPVQICRKLLGNDAIIGLSANTLDLIELVKHIEPGCIDYIGAGALHPTQSKTDATLIEDAEEDSHAFDDIATLCAQCPYPVVVGGGVSVNDLPRLAQTGAAGWFVISAIAGADNPFDAASALVNTWNTATGHQPYTSTATAYTDKSCIEISRNAAHTTTQPQPVPHCVTDLHDSTQRDVNTGIYTNTLAQVAIWPVGTGEELMEAVAQAVDVIQRSGLPSVTHAMSTDIEGDFTDVMRTIEEAVLALYRSGVRTQASIQLDMRHGVRGQITEKIRKVESVLHHKVH